MSNPMYPPPGYPPQAPPQQQPGYPPQQQGYPPQQQQNASGWVDNRTVIGGWRAQDYGMESGKYIEYRVYSKPTSKGGIWKTVEFFKPYIRKNGQQGQGFSFSFNQMKELIEKVNHFINTFCEEKGYFVWQPAGMAQQPQQVSYPPQQQPMQAPPGYPPQPSPQYPPQQQTFAAPGYPPPQQQPAPAPVQPGAPGYPPPPGTVWP